MLHDATLNHLFLGTLDQSRLRGRVRLQLRGIRTAVWPRTCVDQPEPARPPSRCYFECSHAEAPEWRRLARDDCPQIPGLCALFTPIDPKARVVELPHLFVPPAAPALVDTLRFRTQLGLGPRTLLAGVFGHLRESKRLCAILRAMERVWNTGADVKLLVQGAFASSDLERAIDAATRKQSTHSAHRPSCGAGLLALGPPPPRCVTSICASRPLPGRPPASRYA